MFSWGELVPTRGLGRSGPCATPPLNSSGPSSAFCLSVRMGPALRVSVSFEITGRGGSSRVLSALCVPAALHMISLSYTHRTGSDIKVRGLG